MARVQDSSKYHSVEISEESLSPTWRKPHHRSTSEKLGPYTIFILSIGLLGIFFAIILLVILWQGASTANLAEQPTPLWLKIYEKGWVTRVVTVSSVLVRASTTAQMGIFAAIVAAIMLENNNVSFKQLALLSVIRTINNGPLSHIGNMLDSICSQSPSTVRYAYFAVLLLAILNLLALQFTSTILLGDFGTGIVIIKRTTRVPYWRGNGTAAGNWISDPWQISTTRYPRFAEKSEYQGSQADDAYVDTGNILRGLLALANREDRQSLRSYSGPATVTNFRTICVQPNLEVTNMSFVENEGWTIQGRLPENIPHPAINFSSASRRMFSCSALQDSTTDDRGISMCRLHSSSDIQQRPYFVEDNAVPKGIGSSVDMFLMFSISSGDSTVDTQNNISFNPNSLRTWNRTSSGPWLSIAAPMEDSSAIVSTNITLCFAAASSGDFNVSAYGGLDGEEKSLTFETLSWNVPGVSNATLSYHSYDIRRQLGVVGSPSSPISRQYLEFGPTSYWTAVRNETFDWDVDTTPFLFWQDVDDLRDTTKAIFTNGKGSIHHTLSAIFLDVLKTTQDPSKALQALLTIVKGSVYYDVLPYFSDSAPADLSIITKAEIPVRWTGFITIIALVATHFVLIATALVFFSRTKLSLLGNAWQPIAQMATGEARDFVLLASDLTDKEMEMLLDAHACKKRLAVFKKG